MKLLISKARQIKTQPIAVVLSSFGLFLSCFAVVDYSRNMVINEEVNREFKKRGSKHLGDSLEQLHFEAYLQSITFNNIKVNRYKCIELFVLYKRAEMRKLELKNDDEFQNLTESACEVLAASELNNFGQRMCRRAMIRNFYFIKWFKAVILGTTSFQC